MINQYNRLDGVPSGAYYLIHVICPQTYYDCYEDEITYWSGIKQELIDLCIEKNWHTKDAGNHISYAPDFYRIYKKP